MRGGKYLKKCTRLKILVVQNHKYNNIVSPATTQILLSYQGNENASAKINTQDMYFFKYNNKRLNK